jgi:hypothetical protein
MKYLISLTFLGLVACSSNGESDSRFPKEWKVFSTRENGDGYIYAVVIPFTQGDGTRCIVATGAGNNSGIALSCDWSKR